MAPDPVFGIHSSSPPNPARASSPARPSRAAAAWLTVIGLIWSAGCWDGENVKGPGREPLEPPSPVIVSDPVSNSSGAGPGLAAETGVVYVSLPPGAIPNGEVATIRNLRTGSTVTAPMDDGGLDPVPVVAIAGDTLELEVEVTGVEEPLRLAFAVPVIRRPIVVRTDPPPQKRDVPLNMSMLIVFSEPIDAATLTGNSVQLLRGTEAVAGTLEFGDPDQLTAVFVPEAPLSEGTDYTLVVTQGIEDLDGDALETPVAVEFATVGGQLVFSVQPTNMGAGLKITPAVQVTVADALGNAIGHYTGDINIEIGANQAGGSLSGTRTVVAVAGVATFTDLRIDGPGSGYTLVATATGSPSATSAAFNITPVGALTGRIAFSAGGGDPPTSIYVVNGDGTGLTRVAGDWALMGDPSWSPDGTRIAYESNASEVDPEIYVMNADGSDTTNLTNSPAWDHSPAWSPDGARIAFVSNRDGSWGIFVMNADGSAVTRLTSEEHDVYYRWYIGSGGGPVWSPDGAKIAFVRTFTLNGGISSGLFVVNADGSGIAPLPITTAYPPDQGCGPPFAPSWSPDGTKILFGCGGVWVASADGSGATEVTRVETSRAWSAWSPDGTRIVYSDLAPLCEGCGGFIELYVMNADGSDPKLMVRAQDIDYGNAYQPAWSPVR